MDAHQPEGVRTMRTLVVVGPKPDIPLRIRRLLFVISARRGPVRPREDFIVTIDRSDDQTAFIKVRCQLPPRYFTDYLVAMKLNDGWKIVSKSYRYDLRE
jgi:hypothetical protein